MKTDPNTVHSGKLMVDGSHIACPLCGGPLRTKGNFELHCEGCGQLWQSLGRDYRQRSDVFRLKRVKGVSSTKTPQP